MGHTLREGISVVRSRRVLTTLLIAAAFFGAFSEGFDRLWQPRLLEFPMPYFEPIVWVGIISAASLVLGILATEFVNRRVDTNNQVIVARALQIIVALLMALMVVFGLAWHFGVALIAVLALKPIRGMNYPLATAWMNQHVESSVRERFSRFAIKAMRSGKSSAANSRRDCHACFSARRDGGSGLFLIPALYVLSRKVDTGEIADSPLEAQTLNNVAPRFAPVTLPTLDMNHEVDDGVR